MRVVRFGLACRRAGAESGLTCEILPSHAVQTEKEPFGLLDLPDELWVRIGKMVIEDADTVGTRKVWAANKFKTSDCNPPAILQTCRKLRYELLPEDYCTRIRIVIISSKEIVFVGKWIRSITCKARKFIREIELHFTNVRVGNEVKIKDKPDLEAIWGIKGVEVTRTENPYGYVYYHIRLT